MKMEKTPIIRRRKNGEEIEKTRIENGGKTILSNESEEVVEKNQDTEKDLLRMTKKMKAEINGFLAQKNGIKKDEH